MRFDVRSKKITSDRSNIKLKIYILYTRDKYTRLTINQFSTVIRFEKKNKEEFCECIS